MQNKQHVSLRKNIKIKLYKNNAAVWYNKTRRMKQLSFVILDYSLVFTVTCTRCRIDTIILLMMDTRLPETCRE